MQAAERLLQRGGEHARVGKMMINEAVEDLRIYARECYDPGSRKFIARMTDGTELRWKEAKTDYYTPSSFAPRKPDATLFWGYCRAVRLTSDETARDMVKQLGNTLGLGAMGIEDVAAADAQGADEVRTSTSSWRLIYALLELAESDAYADSRAQLMRRAGEIGVRLIKMQTQSGLFPRPGRDWARTGDEIPLALLHLAAALDGFADKLPPPTYDTRFFHCEYDAPLQPHQEKRGDARTYDHYVYYGE
jgi:hypothetical protein